MHLGVWLDKHGLAAVCVARMVACFAMTALVPCFAQPAGVPGSRSWVGWLWVLGCVGFLLAALIYRRQLRRLRLSSRVLRMAEQRYRLIVEGTHVAVWEYDLGSDSFTYFSVSGNSFLGFPLDNWTRSGFWRTRIHPDDVEQALAFLRVQAVQHVEGECDYRMLTADSTVAHVRDLRSVVRDERGRMVAMHGLLMDITANQRSQEALETSEARLRGAFEQAASGMSLCGIDGQLLRVNQRYCEITGYTEGELLLRDFRQITDPADLEANERLLDEAVLGQEHGTLLEKRLIRADGTRVWVSLSLSMVLPKRGGVGQFFEVIEDITARKKAIVELAESEARMRLVLSNMRDGVVLRDARGEVIVANAAARRTYGLLENEVFPPLFDPMGLRYFYEDGSPCPIEELPGARAMRTGVFSSAVVGVERRDGSRVWFVARAEPLPREAGAELHPVVFTVTDISEQRQAEEDLRLAAMVFDNSVEGILVTDADRLILSVNRAFSALTDFDASEALGRGPQMLASSRFDASQLLGVWYQTEMDGSWQGEVVLRRREGGEFPAWLSISAVRDRSGSLMKFVAVFSDITERKASEARIAFLAHHDPLTGLPNRTLFQDRLEQALVRAERHEQWVALLFLDLDRFKTINDSLGHVAGDRLLQAVAQRLQECVRESDTIGRQGGDEFLIVLADLSDAGVPARVAEKILRRLSESFEIDGHILGTSFSIGIAVYPNDGDRADLLMKNADTAMYHAKESGRNAYRFFTDKMNANALDRLKLENHLRQALERGELLLNYQPQFDLETGAIIGAEALIRWQSEALGFVPPGRFISIAEESGIIVVIGRWVLRQAAMQARAWLDAGHRVAVAVNISPLQFRRDDLVGAVREVLAVTSLPPELLELEITESLIMQNAQSVLETVQDLKALGVRLSIDDFGTGYSSLSYLKRFAVDRLKIDQSFVRDLAEDPDDAAIVRAIIQMGRSLKLEVVAEGAESRAQVDFLIREGCGAAQGYFFCPPVSYAVFQQVLERGIDPRVTVMRQGGVQSMLSF